MRARVRLWMVKMDVMVGEKVEEREGGW